MFTAENISVIQKMNSLKIFRLVSIISLFSCAVASSLVFTGYFESRWFNTRGKNDWHYVTITKSPNGNYVWQNAAGKKWTLYPYSSNTLRVGPDCPYYGTKDKGYRYAKFINEGVIGPHKELYRRRACENWKSNCIWTDCANSISKGECALSCNLCCRAFTNCCKFTGYFKQQSCEKDSKNAACYVTVTKSSNNSYTWRNAAGTSWGLYPEDENFLAVGKDCPDYQKGYFFARFTKQGVFGPWLRFYERKECDDEQPSCSKKDCLVPGEKEKCAATCGFCAVDFVGFYENHKYDKGGKNGSHFVNIYKTWDGKSFTWRNAEGQQWKLHPNTGNKLRVDQNCPYYKSGHQYARFNSTGVEGPLNEFYKKEECSDTQSCSLSKCKSYNIHQKRRCALSCGLCVKTSCGCRDCAA